MKLFAITQKNNGFPAKPNGLEKKRRLSEDLVQFLLFLAGILSIFTTLGIVVTLGREAWLFFRLPEVNLLEFLTGTTWQPHIQQFGILPLAVATLVTTAIAMVIAIPFGLTVAIFLSEYAAKNPQHPQANPGTTGGDSDNCLWLFCPNLCHAVTSRNFRQGCGKYLQYRICRAGYGDLNSAFDRFDQ